MPSPLSFAFALSLSPIRELTAADFEITELAIQVPPMWEGAE